MLTPLLLVCLALQQAPRGMPPLTGALAAPARATLRISKPAPAGTLAKAQLREAALARLAQNQGRWRLLAASGEESAAWLELPRGSAPKRFALSCTAQTSVAGTDAQWIVDRGAAALPLNQLAFVLADTHYLGQVQVEASTDGKIYNACGPVQLICQEIRAGQILSINQIACDPGNRRYIRLTLSGGGQVSLQGLEGWFESMAAAAAAKHDAALGSMRNGASPGQHLWPLILQDNSALITEIALQAAAPAELRQVSIVRLDEHLAPLRTVSSFVWAGRLRLGTLTRDATRTRLPAGSTAEPWGIVVEDEQLPPLQLKSVQVWAAEAWLYFIMPEHSALELRFGAPATLSLSADELDLASAISCGEFAALSPLEDQARQQDQAGHPLPAGWLSAAAKWWPTAAYGLAALIALGISLALRRRKRSADAA